MRTSSLLQSLLGSCSITAVVSQASSGPSSGAAIGSKYPFYNLTQVVDHGGNGTATFNQRYQLITDHFKPGGPILFTQSAESALVPVENCNFFDWAEELGAIVATLEHRFFGTSFPQSFNGSTASYAPLTLENVIEDAVTFIEFIKKNVPGAANSKTIVTGGSYGGNLALAFRVKRPETFFGSFASAPLTESFGPLVNNSAKYHASEQLSNIYYDQSAAAAAKIQAALIEFQHCALTEKNCTEAIPDLNLCGTSPNATEFAMIYSSALSHYRYIPQFNYAIRSVYGMPYPFQYLINATLTAFTPGEILRIPLAMANWQTSLSECIDWTTANITGKFSAPISRSFFYLQCQYYPISENAVPPGKNLLPPADITSRVEVCLYPEYQSSIYNQTNEFIQQYLGTATEIIGNSTRLIILQGGYDRDAGVGMPNLPLSDDRQRSRVIFTAGLGHTEDTFPESIMPRGIRPQLDEVRDTKLEYAKEWLGWYNWTRL